PFSAQDSEGPAEPVQDDSPVEEEVRPIGRDRSKKKASYSTARLESSEPLFEYLRLKEQELELEDLRRRKQAELKRLKLAHEERMKQHRLSQQRELEELRLTHERQQLELQHEMCHHFKSILTNGMVTSTYNVLLKSALVGMGEVVTKEALAWHESHLKILQASELIARIHNDVASFKFERKRAPGATSIDAYVKTFGVPEHVVVDELDKMIENLSLSNEEEEINPWGANFHRRDHGFRPRQRSQDLGIKVDILDFEGKPHPNEFIDWLHTVERVFDIKNLSDEQKVNEFDRLRMRCGVDEEEEQTVARYLASLRPETADVVHLQQYWSYNDVCRLSLKVEGKLKKKTSSSRFTSRVMGNEMGKRVVGLGHFAADRPNRQIVTILEEDFWPVFDECGDEVEENVFDQEEITYVDSEEALVVRRTLSTVVANEDELWLRHGIFHTMCTCKGKVCNVIIDGGSCENVISATMVSKLSLMTEEHPHPYKLSWFKKGNEVRVSQRCLVNFSLGKKYSDEVWCDVVPMDACHMLLGRPWQFDRKTMYDGYKNTYSFKKDGETIILGPSDIRKESKNQRLSQAKFLAEAQDATNVYALVVVESNECRFDVPHEVKAILDDFADVVPDELPPGLPPMRDIQHCIDFVPEAVIPHKAAYRMNPKEHEDLQS
nr:hypothetical protein [Tanacetum cinerariifolium]